MKKLVSLMLALALSAALFSSCGAKPEPPATQEPTAPAASTEPDKPAEPTYSAKMTEKERNSVLVGKLSPEQEFYDEIVEIDPECAQYIEEISVYDEEIDDTFVVHLCLPPEWDETKEYPMLVMTDGVWRMGDHLILRELMENGEIEPIITVSIGYPNGYDYEELRKREFLHQPESYLHFIADNLVPYLLENYPASRENMTLAGHSYGGFWTFFALFNSDTVGKHTFTNYYIGSPSFQASSYGVGIADYEEDYHSRNTALESNVYVTVGSQEPEGFIIHITNFIGQLQRRDYAGLNLRYDIIDGYSHNNVFEPSIRNAAHWFYGKQ